MIVIKSPPEIEKMRKAGKITAKALAAARKMVEPGVTTGQIDEAVRQCIESFGARPAFLGYNGFPGSACISVNDEVIHGIPGKKKLSRGDIVSIDVGAVCDGFIGDAARTFPVGEISPQAQRLIDVTKQSFFAGMKMARPGARISDISAAVQKYAESFGYGVVREYTGHGVGAALHEAPEIPNYGLPGHGPRLLPGMTLAVEPMINEGSARIRLASDGWTVFTKDGKLSAHYENTVLITAGEPEYLTLFDEDDNSGPG